MLSIRPLLGLVPLKLKFRGDASACTFAQQDPLSFESGLATEGLVPLVHSYLAVNATPTVMFLERKIREQHFTTSANPIVMEIINFTRIIYIIHV